MVVEPKVALSVTGVLESTPKVTTVKEAEVAPAAIETVEGTVALALLELNATTKPPVGAGAAKATVPVG